MAAPARRANRLRGTPNAFPSDAVLLACNALDSLVRRVREAHGVLLAELGGVVERVADSFEHPGRGKWQV